MTIYRQYDSRWGSLPYPSKPYTLSRSGCGCVAVTHCVIERPKYKNLTPKDVRKYMVQFATLGNGTRWEGIKKGLEHYGYKVHWNKNDGISDIVKVIKKAPIKRGVFLMGSSEGGSEKIEWTKDGHYICFYDFKQEGNDYLFKIKDSGSRKHDGWFSYKKHIKGDLRQAWICTGVVDDTIPVPKPTTKYSGTIAKPTLEKGDSGSQVKYLQKFLNWYCGAKLTVDGQLGDKTEDKIFVLQKSEDLTVDGIYGSKSYNKALAYKAETPKTSKPIADVSYWQGNIDWSKASKELSGVILRCSYTGQSSFTLSVDSTFSKNLRGAYENGLPVGAYHYSQATTVTEAKKEAEFLCKKLAPYKKKITLPVVCDWEFGGRLNSNKAKQLGKTKCNAIVSAFCEVVREYGFTPMVYANYSTFSNYLSVSSLKSKYQIWLAQYSSKASMDYDLWQYTSSGKISGISGKVDLNKVRL